MEEEDYGLAHLPAGKTDNFSRFLFACHMFLSFEYLPPAKDSRDSTNKSPSSFKISTKRLPHYAS
jgi:hypothetical protein